MNICTRTVAWPITRGAAGGTCRELSALAKSSVYLELAVIAWHVPCARSSPDYSSLGISFQFDGGTKDNRLCSSTVELW